LILAFEYHFSLVRLGVNEAKVIVANMLELEGPIFDFVKFLIWCCVKDDSQDYTKRIGWG
jgi:hypothetical protein